MIRHNPYGRSPREILQHIKLENESAYKTYADYTYVIMGRPGPTGKTWLRNQLVEAGYKAIELSEDLVGLVYYKDDGNYFRVNHMKKTVLIVLNRSIREGIK